jgi:hypothetical protein
MKCEKLINRDKDRIASYCVCCGNDNLLSSPAVLMPFIAHRVFDWRPVCIDESWKLSTIPTGNAFSICKTLSCPGCRFIFLDIRFSGPEMARLYRAYREVDYTQLRDMYEPGYAERNKLLESKIPHIKDVEKFLAPYFRPDLQILDWGGDTGINTPFADFVDTFDIYDISDKSTVPKAKRVTEQEAAEKDYDVIICSNVLEHIPYPAEVLMSIKKCMRKDTVLYIEVPLEKLMLNETPDSYLQKKHWHEHVNFFSEASLRSVLRATGFSVKAMQRLQIRDGDVSSFQWQVVCVRDEG